MPKKGNIPWNKGKKMSDDFCKKVSESKKGTTPWNKGQTIETDERLKVFSVPCSEEKKKKISIANSGENNGMYGHVHSEEEKENKSIKMKNLIAEGKFTPNIHNSLTHYQFVYKNKKFRSSWEAAFFSLNQHLLYEKHRISYFDSSKQKDRIYITDFTDEELKIIYEIKPSVNEQKNKDKLSAGKKWCVDNNYNFVIINEDWFVENHEAIMNTDLPLDIKNRLKGLK